MEPNVVETLTERGFVSQKSHADLGQVLANPVTLYAGFDPTADSLHIGSLMQIMLLAQFQRHGHRPIVLIGGATAMIGDPSGKSEERNLLDPETIETNVGGIRGQLQRFLDFSDGPHGALLRNNADWLGRFRFVDFLRDVGKHFRIGEMMGKESVRKRLQSEAGMSFTEFSYQMLQAYDFLHLYRSEQCRLQVGGDDQWGNITAGIDLIRKLEGQSAYGLTSPLLTTAAGDKFGKTEAGAVWLDEAKTSAYDFYQYWIRLEDRDVIRLLKLFTFLPMEDIRSLERQVETAPEKRQAQKVLAEEVTRWVRGPQQTRLAQAASEMLFGREIRDLGDAQLSAIFADVPSLTIPRRRLDDGWELLEALVASGLCQSRGEAKKLIRSGGVYLNNRRVAEPEFSLTAASLASEHILVLRTGKRNYRLLQFT
ncbi:MAG: tyrosine--tRNA ligase [Sedimentisphaerales bacterium]|nr:tyrosine--tRNA ligase [Sedimentisphaerales bacterium]